jgi:hypothetical protein
MPHSNTRLLSGGDIFLDGWNEGYVVQPAMWKNLETQLFWITTGRVRLDCEMVASVLAV